MTPVVIPEGARRRRPVVALGRGGAQHGDRRRRRPRRDHRRDGREHAGHDERDQGRDCIGGRRAAGRERCAVPSGSRPPDRRGRRNKRRAARLPRPNARGARRRCAPPRRVPLLRPLTTYFQTRAEVAQARRRRSARCAPSTRAERRVPHTSQALLLAREARQLNLVRPGEQLYIVVGHRALAPRHHRHIARTPTIAAWMTTTSSPGSSAGSRARFRASPCAARAGAPAVTRAGAVRRGRQPVPDDLLADVPAPRSRRLARRGGAAASSAGARRRRTTPNSARASRRRPGRSANCVPRSPAAPAAATAARRSMRASAARARPERLKCLHAHVAWALAQPPYALGEAILRETGGPWPARPMLPRRA